MSPRQAVKQVLAVLGARRVRFPEWARIPGTVILLVVTRPSLPPVKLFVYGTLLRGERAHGLLRRARYLGPASAGPGYELLDFGFYPAVRARPGAGCVQGELYGVPGEEMPAIDRYEGEEFLRVRVAIAGGGWAETYLLGWEPLAAPVIPSGDWRRR